MDPKELIALAREIVKPLTQELERAAIQLQKEPVIDFHETLKHLQHRAMEEFLARLEVLSPLRMNQEQLAAFTFVFVSEMNGVLPLNYSHIVVWITGQDSSFIGVMDRSKVPGAHDMVSRNVFPVLKLKQPLAPDQSINLEKVECEFMGDI